MKSMLLVGASACLIVAASPVLAKPAAKAPAAKAPAAAKASTPEAQFKAIYTKEWSWRQKEFGDTDDTPVQGRPLPKTLPHEDPATHARRLAYWEATLKSLDALPSAKLSPAEKVNFGVYRAQLVNLISDEKFHTWEMPLNSDSAFWSNVATTSRRTFHSEKELRAYIGQMRDQPRYFAEEIADMRAGLKRGFSVPRVSLEGRDKSIATVAEVKSAEASDFYEPFKAMPASIPANVQADLRAEAVKAINEAVIPAHKDLLRFMREEYLPQTRTTLAAEAMPDGKAFYRAQIREYTTLDLDPEAIHQMGLAEVARIHAQMLEVMARTGFKGTFPEFLTFLRTDPQFYAKTPQELLNRAAWIAKKVDGKTAQYFGKAPRGRFTIVPVPDSIAPYYTSGRGGPHTYYVNTYDLPSRTLYTLPALTLHEAALGHSFQLSLAEEQSDQPEFRRQSYISAYGEGWALYTEKLGQEMGIYETPYEEFGKLTYEMWRACRLVVDTGIHHKGWTRDQAVAYMRENTALSLHEIDTEIDRYITWPAQALSYKLGEMEIVKLRAKAEKALGPKFDIRAFHDAVLATGSVPLPVLDEAIDRFIASGGKDPVVPDLKPMAPN